MPRFNTTTKQPKTLTKNLAGGDAYSQSARLELASLVLTSMLTDGYYRSADQTQQRLLELLDKVDPLFAAQTAVYARREHGLRTISHVIAGEVALRVKGERWTRPFFETVVRRPDDITEILAYVIAKSGKRPLPNSLKDGLGRTFAQFDAYQLAKYKAEGKAVSLRDAVNLVHPKPVDRNAEALKALMSGSLSQGGSTWEAAISAAGQVDVEDGESRDDAIKAAKGAEWTRLVTERKIGYFALLRNLRNIMTDAPEAIDAACEMLVDETLIKKSLVLPFRYLTAYREISQLPDARRVQAAISQALDKSVSNIPELPGRTLVAMDSSGSMDQPLGKTKLNVADVAAFFSAALYKRTNADVIVFSDRAAYASFDPMSSVMSETEALRRAMWMGGTNLSSVFELASKPYDRVIILSDMQSWAKDSWGYSNPRNAFEAFVKRTGQRPDVFSIDLAGYGTSQFPEPQVYALAGFSEKVFTVMGLMVDDRKALLSAIESVKLLPD